MNYIAVLGKSMCVKCPQFQRIRHPKNSRREYSGITEFSAAISGNFKIA